jgi:hypothetical protein
MITTDTQESRINVTVLGEFRWPTSRVRGGRHETQKAPSTCSSICAR